MSQQSALWPWCVHLEERRLRESEQCWLVSAGQGAGGGGQAPFSCAQWQGEQNGALRDPSECEEELCCEGGRALAQSSQRDERVSLFKPIWMLSSATCCRELALGGG